MPKPIYSQNERETRDYQEIKIQEQVASSSTILINALLIFFSFLLLPIQVDMLDVGTIPRSATVLLEYDIVDSCQARNPFCTSANSP